MWSVRRSWYPAAKTHALAVHGFMIDTSTPDIGGGDPRLVDYLGSYRARLALVSTISFAGNDTPKRQIPVRKRNT